MTISKAVKIDHCYVSKTSLFFLRNIFFYLYPSDFLFFQYMVTSILLLFSFNPFVFKTKLTRYFLASYNIYFLSSTIIFSLKQIPVLINLTSFNLSARSAKCFIVTSEASHCSYKIGQAFFVYIRKSSGSSPG